jgi:nitrous oxidase accessory protein
MPIPRIAGMLLAACLVPLAAGGKTWLAAAGEAPRVIAAASAGDTVVLGPGVHPGPLGIARTPLVIRGAPGAVVDGAGRSSVVEIGAAGTVLEGVEIRGSGSDVMHEDAAVRVIDAPGVRLSRLVVRDVLYGVYAERSPDLRIEHSQLAGRVVRRGEGEGAGEGNGVHLWYCERPALVSNRVSQFVDALYFSFTHDATVEDNLLHDCGRYGFHTMYCQQGTLVRNRFTRNTAGCAIMFSNHLRVQDNAFVRNQGPRTYGLLLRDCSEGTFVGNRLAVNTIGLFMDNSNRNRFEGNLVQGNGWGVLLYSSCARNEFVGNDFIQNDYPVALDMRYTNNQFDDGRTGNYWSDAAAYDLDADGVGDAPFSPVTAFAFLSKQYPDLTLLAHSPSVEALGVAEKVFPSLRPSEAVDHHPLTRPRPMAADATPRLSVESTAARARGGRSWPGLVAFSVLGAIGVSGLARRAGRRA